MPKKKPAGESASAEAEVSAADGSDVLPPLPRNLQWLKPFMPRLDPLLRNKWVLNPLPALAVIYGSFMVVGAFIGFTGAKPGHVIPKQFVHGCAILLICINQLSDKTGIAAQEKQRIQARKEARRKARAEAKKAAAEAAATQAT